MFTTHKFPNKKSLANSRSTATLYLENARKARQNRKLVPLWIWGYILLVCVEILSNYIMNVGGNYTTMRYLDDGYDASTGAWNPTPPLMDNLLPSEEWLKENYKGWIKDLHQGSLSTAFIIVGGLSSGVVILLGRMDIMVHSQMIKFILAVGKLYIGLTFQTPHAGGKEFAIEELGGREEVQLWRDRGFWSNLLGRYQLDHAADMIYSGHTLSIIIWVYASIWALSQSKLPHKKVLVAILAFLNFAGMVTSIGFLILTRYHYSFDIALAIVLWALLAYTPLVWRWSLAVADYFTRQGAQKPWSIERFYVKAAADTPDMSQQIRPMAVISSKELVRAYIASESLSVY